MRFLRGIAARLRSRSIRDVDISDLSHEEFIRLAYLVLLRRKIDPTGLALWRDSIVRGMFSYETVVSTILKSDEYQSRFGTDVNGRLHSARQLWIKTLPPFERLLDIGGSSPTRPEGALIQLGYPHRPKSLDILDLPPERQNWGTPAFDQSVPTRFDWGTVTYFHGGAETIADVPTLQDRTYDCVFLGQAVEHIRPEALPELLAWVRRHLSADGRLILDTPNRLLTKIQCPTWFIHPDHKLEYEPAQLEQVLRDNGFVVTRRRGMVHLPKIAATKTYDAREFESADLLHDDIDACYLFAVEASLDRSTDNTVAS